MKSKLLPLIFLGIIATGAVAYFVFDVEQEQTQEHTFSLQGESITVNIQEQTFSTFEEYNTWCKEGYGMPAIIQTQIQNHFLPETAIAIKEYLEVIKLLQLTFQSFVATPDVTPAELTKHHSSMLETLYTLQSFLESETNDLDKTFTTETVPESMRQIVTILYSPEKDLKTKIPDCKGWKL